MSSIHRSLFLSLVTQSPTDYLYTISIAFPARNASMFTVTAHYVSPPPKQVHLPAPIPLVLSDTTAASRRLAPPAAPRPPPRPPRARPPCPRPPPASALLTQAQALWSTTFTTPARAAPLLLLHIVRASFGIDACCSADAHCSPRAGQDHPAASCAAPTRASRPPALHGRASRRSCRPPARPHAPPRRDNLVPSRAARPRWVRLTTPRRGCSLS
jgi:hypothetical protein